MDSPYLSATASLSSRPTGKSKPRGRPDRRISPNDSDGDSGSGSGSGEWAHSQSRASSMSSVGSLNGGWSDRSDFRPGSPASFHEMLSSRSDQPAQGPESSILHAEAEAGARGDTGQEHSGLHRCWVCGEAFPRYRGLIMHMSIHPGERTYKCTIITCSRSFIYRADARCHSKRHELRLKTRDRVSRGNSANSFKLFPEGKGDNSAVDHAEMERSDTPATTWANHPDQYLSVASTSSIENSEEEWDPASRNSRTRHHPYQSHHSAQRRSPLSVSPSHHPRRSVYSNPSQAHDTREFLRVSASASANASADEGSNSNSNSYYNGNSPVASMSTTSSPIFVTDGQVNFHQRPNGSPSAERPGICASNSNGDQSTTPLSLYSLPSYPPDQKPPFSYPVLIRLAILGSPQKRLLLSQIYSAIEEKFPWYRDSAPKAWKASVRHCLSLNKEFVRMQRAVEDPGVGCGGWWSVGEGMKGLKRPRKRRPAQSRQAEHERDPTPIVQTHTSSPAAISRSHSTTFGDDLAADSYTRYISSSSLPPSAVDPHRAAGIKERGDALLRPIDEYSLRLPSFRIPNAAYPTPTLSRAVMYGSGRGSGAEIYSQYTPGQPFTTRDRRDQGTHTPTMSSSSSCSIQSYGSASSASDSDRPNPMSISSLLNADVEMKPAKVETPFRSDRTLLPPPPS